MGTLGAPLDALVLSTLNWSHPLCTPRCVRTARVSLVKARALWGGLWLQVDYRPNHFHYNSMIGLLGAAGQWKQVVSLAEQAQAEGLEPDAIMYTLLMRNASG